MNRSAASVAFAFLSGALFGVGLVVSGMTDPGKVRGFLDVAGNWDPSLAFVMMGAIGTHAVWVKILRARSRPLFDDAFHVPTSKGLDANVLLGSALFGIGWGISGYCPGPAVVSIGTWTWSPVVFVAAMSVGMVLRSARRPPAP
ncbi:MAG: YeeE/YedE family protein [Polyangiaceae bacterium]